MATHLKDKDLELWAEILRRAQECADQGGSATDFYRAIRPLCLVSSAVVINWIDAGLIPSYRRVGRRIIEPRRSCNILATEK